MTTQPMRTQAHRPGSAADPAGPEIVEDSPVVDDRAADLLATARSFWPEPARVSVRRRARGARAASASGETVRELLVIPNATHPRLLVPADAPRAAAAAVRSYAHGSGLAHRLGRGLAAGFMATGLADRVLPDRLVVRAPEGLRGPAAFLEEHLRELLRPDALIGVRIGSPRANRKPVLPVMGRDGRLLAYVKVGHNDLTRELVKREGQALSAIGAARPRTFEAPRVLHEGMWRDFALLVMSPLSTRRGSSRRDDLLPVQAMTELASLFGVQQDALADSAWWKACEVSVSEVRDPATTRVLREVMASIAARHGGSRVRFGSWHGDWAPWNMGWSDAGVLLWDWERCATGVPLGFDPLHYRIQAALVDGHLDDARRAYREQGPATLALAGVTADADEQRLTGLLYLLEISLRYVLDAQGPTGGPLRHIAEWSTAMLVDEAASL